MRLFLSKQRDAKPTVPPLSTPLAEIFDHRIWTKYQYGKLKQDVFQATQGLTNSPPNKRPGWTDAIVLRKR